jgi:hypothetical protein
MRHNEKESMIFSPTKLHTCAFDASLMAPINSIRACKTKQKELANKE